MLESGSCGDAPARVCYFGGVSMCFCGSCMNLSCPSVLWVRKAWSFCVRVLVGGDRFNVG